MIAWCPHAKTQITLVTIIYDIQVQLQKYDIAYLTAIAQYDKSIHPQPKESWETNLFVQRFFTTKIYLQRQQQKQNSIDTTSQNITLVLLLRLPLIRLLLH
jgi:hypothetical protein